MSLCHGTGISEVPKDHLNDSISCSFVLPCVKDWLTDKVTRTKRRSSVTNTKWSVRKQMICDPTWASSNGILGTPGLAFSGKPVSPWACSTPRVCMSKQQLLHPLFKGKAQLGLVLVLWHCTGAKITALPFPHRLNGNNNHNSLNLWAYGLNQTVVPKTVIRGDRKNLWQVVNFWEHFWSVRQVIFDAEKAQMCNQERCAPPSWDSRLLIAQDHRIGALEGYFPSNLA